MVVKKSFNRILKIVTFIPCKVYLNKDKKAKEKKNPANYIFTSTLKLSSTIISKNIIQPPSK